MKKFSKINNIKVINEPIENIEESLESKLKKTLISIMDKTLKIQSYGSVDNRFLSGSVKVDGKELLAEAIIDFFNDLSNNKDVTVLENLKNKVKDWETIDKEIEFIKAKKQNYLNRFKITKILERYKYDKDLLTIILKNKINISTDTDFKNHIIEELKKNNLENLLD
jgi:hypothetical protein